MIKCKDFRDLAKSITDRKTKGYIQTIEDLSKACRREHNLKDPEGLRVGIRNLRTTLERRKRNVTTLVQERQISILLNAVDKIELTLEDRLSRSM